MLVLNSCSFPFRLTTNKCIYNNRFLSLFASGYVQQLASVKDMAVGIRLSSHIRDIIYYQSNV